jgi:hypothetical protein
LHCPGGGTVLRGREDFTHKDPDTPAPGSSAREAEGPSPTTPFAQLSGGVRPLSAPHLPGERAARCRGQVTGRPRFPATWAGRLVDEGPRDRPTGAGASSACPPPAPARLAERHRHGHPPRRRRTWWCPRAARRANRRSADLVEAVIRSHPTTQWPCRPTRRRRPCSRPTRSLGKVRPSRPIHRSRTFLHRTAGALMHGTVMTVGDRPLTADHRADTSGHHRRLV